MSLESVYVRTPTVALMIALAAILPRFVSQTKAEYVAVESDLRSRVTVDYAHKRLWVDFLALRRDIDGTQPAEPTLAEYRAFLARQGLYNTGDAMILLVVPGTARPELPERLEITLTSSPDPLTLRVALRDGDYGPRPMGQLILESETDGSISCEARPVGQDRLWSLWPLTPQPLLP